ncbi:MAG: methylenetetrahydrofolate reductase [Arenicellales bacterium]|nr:methylenetetrahydrofolate reductase [Arenicellales bacterium]
MQRRPLPRAHTVNGDISVSFEFFPPQTEASKTILWNSIERLSPLSPEFVSITYGAGGSTRHRTHDTVKRIIEETSLVPAAHLTCVDATRKDVNGIADDYWRSGVRHIVALRGDSPDGGSFRPHPNGYENAAALVAGLAQRHSFDISVAAYPEVHPDAVSAAADLDNLKRKIDAGAKRAITQFFFDADTYLRFRDRVSAAGIQVPIVPGILPVTNFTTLKKFAARCGTSVPAWVGVLFEGLDDAPDIRQLVSATITAELCTRLVDHGVSNFHFYTLNRCELTLAICRILGIRPDRAVDLRADSPKAAVK